MLQVLNKSISEALISACNIYFCGEIKKNINTFLVDKSTLSEAMTHKFCYLREIWIPIFLKKKKKKNK